MAYICLYCEEPNCIACSYGNPCLGCSDYDRENDACRSSGGCGYDYIPRNFKED